MKTKEERGLRVIVLSFKNQEYAIERVYKLNVNELPRI